MKFRFVLVGSLIGFVIASSCDSSEKTCDITSCPNGCCDSAANCRTGNTDDACGSGARLCLACASSQTCTTITGTVEASACTAKSKLDAGTPTPPVDAGTAVDAGTPPPSDAGAGATDAGVIAALNEISARGAEFVELYATKSGDLGGYALADSESDGGPKRGEALHFPSGTTVTAGAFIVVMTGQTDAGVSTLCPGGTSLCFQATFGVSNSRGETVWLLGPNDTVVDSQNYPANGADAGSSLGRKPDGTGAWQVITPATPGAAN